MDQNNINQLLGQSLYGYQKEKIIKTPNLSISGHLLRWADVIIQIDNISLITTSSYQKEGFPIWAFLFVAGGVALLPFIWFLGLICLALAAAIIYGWYREYQKTKDYRYLHIYLNSGRSFSLLFIEEPFLNKVFDIFANIFEDGGEAVQGNIFIDLNKCNVQYSSDTNINVDVEGNIDNQSSIINTLNTK